MKKYIGKAKLIPKKCSHTTVKNTHFGYCAYDKVSKALITTCSQQENLIAEGKEY